MQVYFTMTLGESSKIFNAKDIADRAKKFSLREQYFRQNFRNTIE